MTTYTGLDPATGRLLAVEVGDGRILSVAESSGDLAGAGWLAPGLVDLQVNGFGGFDVNGPEVTADTVIELVRALAVAGTTTFVPTVITASEADIVRSLQAIAAARSVDPATRSAIPFAHVEGPHLSPDDGPRGVHPVEHIRPPDVAEFTRWQEASGGLVGMVTLSPHHPASAEYVRALSSAGVLVAVGHTAATPDEIIAAVDAGATLSTHLGNGADAVLPRHPNYLWTQLADDRLTAGFIADGHHLPGDTLTAMLRAKGLDRSILVSDSVALAGSPPGDYRTPVGGTVQLTESGRLSYAGTPYLAGAARSLADCVATATELGRIRLADAIRLATANPGRFVGGRGELRPGEPADLIEFDWAPGDKVLRLRKVVQAGQEVGR
ncbi:N-acetylglucosamine-6-phosphate deacetylase [Kribbella amoyensis]|uniref:N-acetylglucosamine-6-phosphate deacetylase n=1 Tax=Kribbella amoyensis TaxID=996641 RepID=A0A561BN40_9ACTN|nr:amidohydrolase family protein [Kribbella amoyensis]TWD80222.1 N-acetylglucosamine-6-phosphate deacetylase [Kribbella amoyensis]